MEVGVFLRVRDGEQPVVEPNLARDGFGIGDPVDRPGHLAAVGRRAAAAVGVVGAAELPDPPTLGSSHDLAAGDQVAVLEADLAAGSQPAESLRGILLEVIPFDEDLARERDFARSCLSYVGRKIGRVEPFHLALRVVLDLEAQRLEHAHAARRSPVQIVPHHVLERADVHALVRLRDADEIAEAADRRGGHAATPESGQRRHPRIVPPVYAPNTRLPALAHELSQLALAHDGVIEVQAGELGLPWPGIPSTRLPRFDVRARVVDDPVVQLAVRQELQRAKGVGDALDRV